MQKKTEELRPFQDPNARSDLHLKFLKSLRGDPSRTDLTTRCPDAVTHCLQSVRMLAGVSGRGPSNNNQRPTPSLTVAIITDLGISYTYLPQLRSNITKA